MISVITTTYNYDEFIVEAIKSILNQTFKDFEYLIIDDGSTDRTEYLIKSINDDRIKYYKINHRGRAAALNFGLTKAQFEIIALMDADDIADPTRFEQEMLLLKNQNQFIFCESAFFKNGKVKYILKSPKNINELKLKILLHGHLNNSSALFYKNHIIENQGYTETLGAYEDYELWLRLLNKSEFIIISNFFHYVRLHKKSLTTSNQSKLKNILYNIQEDYFKDLQHIVNLNDQHLQYILQGWREFFFGNRRKAREFWSEVNLIQRGLKIQIAYLLSYLPNNFIDILLNNRIILRLEYFAQKLKTMDKVQRNFNSIRTGLLNKS